MFRNCQPSVTYFPSGFRNLTLPVGKSWIRLRENTCVTSNTDTAFSARVSSGFCGSVCRITPVFEINRRCERAPWWSVDECGRDSADAAAESAGYASGESSVRVRRNARIFPEPDPGFADRQSEIPEAAREVCDGRLAISEHHDAHERAAVHGVFRDSADGRGGGGNGPARSGVDAGFVDKPDDSRRLFRAGRGQCVVLLDSNWRAGRDGAESGAVRGAREKDVSRAWIASVRYRADQEHIVWAPRPGRVGDPAVPGRVFQYLQHGELWVAVEHGTGQRVWDDQQDGGVVAADSIFTEAGVLTKRARTNGAARELFVYSKRESKTIRQNSGE